ncbi:hypothetical protein VPH35_006244 [Triticum aestivum]
MTWHTPTHDPHSPGPHPRCTHTHAQPTHTHPRWIPSLSSSSIPFLHPTPPPDSGDPRGSPLPSSPPRGHLSPLTISTDRFLSSPRRATPRHWWWCAARRPQRRRAAVVVGTTPSAWSGWSQPFKILNGGISALMTESTASIGGYMALGYRRVAGVQLYINHLKPARLGDRIKAKANPIRYLDPDAYLDKDQLLDAVHWIRQAVGLACGLLWGAVPLVGAF